MIGTGNDAAERETDGAVRGGCNALAKEGGGGECALLHGRKCGLDRRG